MPRRLPWLAQPPGIGPTSGKHACPRCHDDATRFLTLYPSRRKSPVCRKCFYRSIWNPPRDEQGRFGYDKRPLVGKVRALGHDRREPSDLRQFALAFLEDTDQADDWDLSALRLLEGGYEPEDPETLGPDFVPPVGVRPEAHGAAFPDTGAPGTAPDPQTDPEAGERPDGTTTTDPTEGGPL